MIPPSKEEIAAEVGRSRRWLDKFAGKGLKTANRMHGTIVALDDENKRLRSSLAAIQRELDSGRHLLESRVAILEPVT